MDTSQYLLMFLEESFDNLQILNKSLLQLEKNPSDMDIVNEIFRVMHTLKGMSATMGFIKMAELTNLVEDVLAKVRNGQCKVTSRLITKILLAVDVLEKMLNNIQNGSEKEFDIEFIEEELNLTQKEDTEQEHSPKDIEFNEYDISIIKYAKEQGYNSVNIVVSLRKDTVMKSARAFLIVQELEIYGEIIKACPSIDDMENENFDTNLQFVLLTKSFNEVIREKIINISEVQEVICSYLDEDRLKPGINKSKNINDNEQLGEEHQNSNRLNDINNRKVNQSVRVDSIRIDKLMNMVSELVINRGRLEQLSSKYESTELNRALKEMERTTKDIQEVVMKIRMMPLSIIFSRFPRMIRDISQKLNKEVEFYVEGDETELDRTVIDEIVEPLMHILRNAVDHGIESKEERVKKGKAPIGTIKLQAYQEATKAIIRVEDDGAGINIEGLKATAKNKGISTDGMTEEEIINLIFNNGFTTTSEVTDISGRGVGMSVVKEKISSLGGNIEVLSKEGLGSIFIITQPLSLRIVQAVLVQIGYETFGITLNFVDRIIECNEKDIEEYSGTEVIKYEGQTISLIRTNNLLNISSRNNHNKYVIIAHVRGETVGILVDSLVGQQEVVIKPLSKSLENLKEYIGASILVDGSVMLILDVAELVNLQSKVKIKI